MFPKASRKEVTSRRKIQAVAFQFLLTSWPLWPLVAAGLGESLCGIWEPLLRAQHPGGEPGRSLILAFGQRQVRFITSARGSRVLSERGALGTGNCQYGGALDTALDKTIFTRASCPGRLLASPTQVVPLATEWAGRWQGHVLGHSPHMWPVLHLSRRTCSFLHMPPR